MQANVAAIVILQLLKHIHVRFIKQEHVQDPLRQEIRLETNVHHAKQKQIHMMFEIIM